MWGLEQGLRLWVCQRSVSMRYGIRGLTQMSTFKNEVQKFRSE